MIHPMIKLTNEFNFFPLSFHLLQFDEKTTLGLDHLIFSKTNLILWTVFHNYHVHLVLILRIQNSKSTTITSLELFKELTICMQLVALDLFFNHCPVLINLDKSRFLKPFNIVTLVMINCLQIAIQCFICEHTWLRHFINSFIQLLILI